ncbi:MAG: GreA/GreB family elongation factor [Verrucomicrobiales bacterium]|nr:GreA/GreB family elongation factor [Verrucomicrobiales bacterium]
MREEFVKLAAAGKIEGRHIEPLTALAESGFCLHRSWGFGRIRSIDPVFARFTIDFPNKPGHTMDLAFAAETLKPIRKDHILVRKATNLAELRQMAATNPVGLVRLVLESYGGKATVEQIQQVLVPDVIGEDWKKWWETTKRQLKKDGHFSIPLKKTEPIQYQERLTTIQDQLLNEFQNAKGLKARIAVATEVLKNAHDLPDLPGVAAEIIEALNAEIVTHQRTQPAVALEAIFVRDELRAAAGLPPAEGELTAEAIWTQDVKFGQVMEQIPAAKHRRALESFKAANPDKWAEVLLGAINSVSARLCREFAQVLIAEGKLDQLKETLVRLINQHMASSELLLWLAKDRSDAFADIIGPEMFRAMLSAMEDDLFSNKRGNRLRDYLVADPDLLADLIGSADLEVVTDLTRALQLSPCFDDERDRRSLLGRILKICPAIQPIISGEQVKQDAALLVSWESLERRKREYQDLVHKKIPENSKEIAIARSYGDLSENYEYKAAKEMQKLLLRRKAELELELSRARGTDFSDATGETVSPGTVVKLTELETGHTETFTILGAWDSDPERGIISYLSPIAQVLMGHKPGEEVLLELEHGQKRYRIESITPYKQVQTAATPDKADVVPAASAEPDHVVQAAHTDATAQAQLAQPDASAPESATHAPLAAPPQS